MSSREAFEQYAVKQGSSIARESHGAYTDYKTQVMWMAWEARRLYDEKQV